MEHEVHKSNRVHISVTNCLDSKLNESVYSRKEFSTESLSLNDIQKYEIRHPYEKNNSEYKDQTCSIYSIRI
jgi:hypothetical protein